MKAFDHTATCEINASGRELLGGGDASAVLEVNEQASNERDDCRPEIIVEKWSSVQPPLQGRRSHT